MKTIWLCISLLLLLESCSKKENVKPGDPTKGTGTLAAVFSISSLLQSNMVVQRDKPFLIWGQAPAKLKITVKISWNTILFNAVADDSGTWKVVIPASAANAMPQTIIAKADGAADVTLTNVVIGDVWVCSGQSNMAFPVDSITPFQGVLNYKAEIAAANYPQIRMLAVQEDNETAPLLSFKFSVTWAVCSPSTIGKTSAIAYYFARKLNITLNVPVGIIVSAINGSYCQDWANVNAIANDPLLSGYLSGSSTLYNGMINPLINLSVKGFIWYQGENNQHDSPPSAYTRLNSALIQGWRTQFNQGLLPFYYAQLTPFAEDYNSTTPPGGNLTADYLALFREAQSNIRSSSTGTGMAVTMDVGEVANHHPRNKKPVGERLALLALNYTYGQGVQCIGPQYASFSANQYTATVNFVPGTANGLNTINGSPLNQFFFVSGIDHIFRRGSATINGSSIIITAPQGTPLPIQAVRYAFTNAPVTNLQNSAGLPAEPFRTDNWNN